MIDIYIIDTYNRIFQMHFIKHEEVEGDIKVNFKDGAEVPRFVYMGREYFYRVCAPIWSMQYEDKDPTVHGEFVCNCPRLDESNEFGWGGIKAELWEWEFDDWESDLY